MTELDEATKELDEAYRKVREDLGRVFVTFEDLRDAGPTSDISAILDQLEEVVKDVRTGGLIGSGANRHRRAREAWIKAGGQPD